MLMPGLTSVPMTSFGFIPTSVIYCPAIDGIPYHERSSVISANNDNGREFPAGDPSSRTLKQMLESVDKLARDRMEIMAKDRNVGLPIEKWERQRHLRNVQQIAFASAPFLLGLAPLTIAYAAFMVFNIAVPPRFIAIPFVVEAWTKLKALHGKLIRLEEEASPLMSKIKVMEEEMNSHREANRLRRKKDLKKLKDAEDNLRKKWHEMEQGLKEMQKPLRVLAEIHNYFQGWILRLNGLIVLPLMYLYKLFHPRLDEGSIERLYAKAREVYEWHLLQWKEMGFYYLHAGRERG